MTLYLILFSMFVITALYRLERRVNQIRSELDAWKKEELNT